MLRKYAAEGIVGLVDGSAKPLSCPHQMPPEVEARIVELRRLSPGWGPRSIRFRLEAERLSPLPGRSSIYRCLVRHGLIEPEARRRKKADDKRWERSRAMELWQMDVVGGVQLVDGWRASIVSGVDDHSRFVISARVVERATAQPVCDALAFAMRTFGVPREILTDNGKVFTGRFGPGTGEVLFDRICRENGIKHILTAPRSPTTTGKVERWHKTLRREFLNGRVFESIADAQEQLDRWVHDYNFERRHQGIGDVVPWERFRLAVSEPADPVEPVEEPTTTRRVGKTGKISFAAQPHALLGFAADDWVCRNLEAHGLENERDRDHSTSWRLRTGRRRRARRPSAVEPDGEPRSVLPCRSRLLLRPTTGSWAATPRSS